MSEVKKIKLSEIVPNRAQPRLDFYDDSIEGLALSIKENGLLQPISVREVDGHYELIAGERRYRACLLNGYEEIDAIVLKKTDEESANLALVENLQREDLNAIEEALAMKQIMKTMHLTQAELAKRLGYRQSTVANKIRLLKLPDFIKNAISHGEITERHARALLKVDKEKLEDVYLTITNRKYNVSKTEEYIRELNAVHKRKGVSNNVMIAVNTINQALDLCKKSGLDIDVKQNEHDDDIKITIVIKK